MISDTSPLFWHPAPSVTAAQCHPAGSDSNRFVETDLLSKSIHINHIKYRHIIFLPLYFQTLVTYLMCFYNSIHAAKQKCWMYSTKASFFSSITGNYFLPCSRAEHFIISLIPMAQQVTATVQHVPRAWKRGKQTDTHPWSQQCVQFCCQPTPSYFHQKYPTSLDYHLRLPRWWYDPDGHACGTEEWHIADHSEYGLWCWYHAWDAQICLAKQDSRFLKYEKWHLHETKEIK